MPSNVGLDGGGGGAPATAGGGGKDKEATAAAHLPSLHSMVVRAVEPFASCDTLLNEDGLESELCRHLETCGYIVKRQVRGGSGRDRYDIVCRHPSAPGKTVCVEVKMKATSAALEQFDRYVERFKDGLVIVCWSATQPVRDAVRDVSARCGIPVAVVEVGRNHALA